jgi:hypothetical protein
MEKSACRQKIGGGGAGPASGAAGSTAPKAKTVSRDAIHIVAPYSKFHAAFILLTVESETNVCL